MSHPSLPHYLGTWEDLLNALLHNPFLGGGGGGRLPSTHPENPWRSDSARTAYEPSPSPWLQAVSGLIAAVSLKEVAAKMPAGPAKSELGKRIDSSINEIIDEWCGTRHPGWPWPGPPPWVYPIASTLAAAANTLQEGGVRAELLEVAGQVLQRAFGAGEVREFKVPSPDEIDAMTVFPPGNSECETLCEDLLDALAELAGATGRRRALLHARIGAINRRRKELHCTLCLPQ